MVNSNFSPQDKKPGDLILSADWNAVMTEIKRLDKAKVNREGADTLKGPLTIQEALNVTGNVKISGNLQLDTGREIVFADNGQIRSVDNNHRIIFRRSEDKLELREFGDIIFSPGATAGNETAKVFLKSNGYLGIGTTSPNFHLEVGNKDIVGTWKLGISGKGSTGKFRQWTLRTGDGTNDTEINKLRIRDEQANSDRITIDENGNVMFTGTVTATTFIGIGAFVAGMILMWSGSEANIPNGWALCNGSNKTPDLRGRFVLVSGQGTGLSNRTLNQTGGVERHQLSLSEMPSHNHKINDPGHYHNWKASRQEQGTDDKNYTSELSKGDAGSGDTISKDTDSRSTGITIQSEGGSQAHENMPPFYVLAYIIKL